AKRIERFLWRARSFAPAGAIEVPDGPESLAADGTRAYTHSWKGESYAIDLERGEVVARFQNGCEGARGLALDAAHGLLFAGCAEGKVTSVSLATLQPVGSAPAGKGVDIIAFAPGLRHLYAPAGDAASLTVIAGNAWVCDPAHGRLLVFRDPP
ncbi:MAG TPA: hypothetical protein VFA79_09325, partial [Myxococcales bacterium]|nr:hypothetical protein [Myxococcales bacterium]